MSSEPKKLPCRMVMPSVVPERQELKKLISNAVHSDDVRALQVLEFMGTVRACWAEYLDAWYTSVESLAKIPKEVICHLKY